MITKEQFDLLNKKHLEYKEKIIPYCRDSGEIREHIEIANFCKVASKEIAEIVGSEDFVILTKEEYDELKGKT